MDCSKGAADQEKAEKWYEILKNLENATQDVNFQRFSTPYPEVA